MKKKTKRLLAVGIPVVATMGILAMTGSSASAMTRDEDEDDEDDEDDEVVYQSPGWPQPDSPSSPVPDAPPIVQMPSIPPGVIVPPDALDDDDDDEDDDDDDDDDVKLPGGIVVDYPGPAPAPLPDGGVKLPIPGGGSVKVPPPDEASTPPLPPAPMPPPAPAPALEPITAELLADLLQAEKSPGWKRVYGTVKAWQAKRGLTKDGKFGPGSALKLSLEAGTIPIIRYWPASAGARPDIALEDYRAALREVADRVGGQHGALLRISAERETGQSFGPPQGDGGRSTITRGFS